MLKNAIYVKNLFAVIVLAIIFQASEARAAWGDLDTSFGFGGVAIDAVTGYVPRDVAFQPDGKILVTGYRTSNLGGNVFFLRRYLSNGSLDTAFGLNGEASGFSSGGLRLNHRGQKIAVLPNGKIAVVGTANGFYAVWQVTASGRNDRTFGQNGLEILSRFPAIGSSEINIQSGKILLSLAVQSDSTYIALLRLTSSGTLDGTFNGSGVAVTSIFQTANGEGGTVVDADGKITVGGRKSSDFYHPLGLERRLENGQPDPSFLPTDSATFDLRGGLVKLANGKYAMRSMMLDSNFNAIWLVKEFSSAGAYESNTSLFGGFYTTCPNIFANQSDGKVVIFGTDRLFRLNAELDAMETLYCSDLAGIPENSRASIQSDDKMVVFGVDNGRLMLTRLLPD